MPSFSESSFPEMRPIDSAWKSRLRRLVKRWYRPHSRDLPWRHAKNPYHVWISEIMLQQTTIVAVVPYFERFLKKFPTVQSLAQGKEADVLSHWEGLGYYSRARNIYKAAQMIIDQFDGVLPAQVEQLQTLPGIGRYTAGAICAFAFDQRTPIVEANTLRLYSRLLGYRKDPRASQGQKLLWEFAEVILPQKEVAYFNQALMDLGQLVCKPDKPDCQSCPVSKNCFAFLNQETDRIPVKKKRPQITEHVEVCVAIRKGNRFLLRKRTESERWAGLWDFPRLLLEEALPERFLKLKKTLSSKDKQQSLTLFSSSPLHPLEKNEQAAIVEQVQKITGLKTKLTSIRSVIQHSVTRYRITLLLLDADVASGRLDCSETELKWTSPKEWHDIPFSMTGRKFANLLSE